MKIVDIFYQALCVEMPIIIAQGLPEIPHHVLGNLRIKIAGRSAKWFFEAQTAGTDKHGGLVVV